MICPTTIRNDRTEVRPHVQACGTRREEPAASLLDADLPDADLPDADLPDADLPDANLLAADLLAADLLDADLLDGYRAVIMEIAGIIKAF